MNTTVILKGVPFTVESWGDIHQLTCRCHPSVDFKVGETVQLDGSSYLLYLVGEHSINLQRCYPLEHFQPKGTVTLTAPPPLPEQYAKLVAENASLRTEIQAWTKERDFLRRSILELYHAELITMSRARELMGFRHVDPVRELYRKLKPEFDRELGDMGYARAEPASGEN